MKKYFLLFFLLPSILLKAKESDSTMIIVLNANPSVNNEFPRQEFFSSDTLSLHSSPAKKHRLIASILSFPFPFGILGLHRIYLGTKPYMPFVYVGTLGGCAGILPLIDFIAIISSSKEKFRMLENNPKVFMWLK
ncbi:MAG: TM2 domain-containing protein [Bacteroidetes bacterium]|nr:TM2 domain-containing protein [Bacteroidota bacterium]